MKHFTATIERSETDLYNPYAYCAEIRELAGFTMVAYVGFGWTRSEALEEAFRQMQCFHIFPFARGSRNYKRCATCGHVRFDN